MIKSNFIKNEIQAKKILDSLKDKNTGVKNYDENSIEYELMCESIQEQFLEVLEYLNLSYAGTINEQSLLIADLITMTVWDYLKDDNDSIERYNEMKNKIIKYINEY